VRKRLARVQPFEYDSWHPTVEPQELPQDTDNRKSKIPTMRANKNKQCNSKSATCCSSPNRQVLFVSSLSRFPTGTKDNGDPTTKGEGKSTQWPKVCSLSLSLAILLLLVSDDAYLLFAPDRSPVCNIYHRLAHFFLPRPLHDYDLPTTHLTVLQLTDPTHQLPILSTDD
jgi:hypothetical protein